MANKARSFSATFRLLKEGKKIADAFSSENKLKRIRVATTTTNNILADVQVYAGQVYESDPSWLDLISEITVEPLEFKNIGSAVVIFIPIGERYFAVSFGMAQICLNRNAFECDFGLKVCLNKIPRDKIRTLDTASPDRTTIQKRIQASAECDFSLFSMDIEKDILRLLSGKPTDKEFASSMTGRDTLQMTCKITISSLKEKCKELLETYQSKEYKKIYPWIDHIKQIRDEKIISILNGKLSDEIQALREGKQSSLYLAIPEIIDPAADYAYRYNGLSCRSRKYFTLSIEDYKAALQREVSKTISDYTKHRISIISSNFPCMEFSIFECLNFETSVDDRNYILWNSSWYEIDINFAREIDHTWQQALVEDEYLIQKTSMPTEEKLIEDLGRNMTSWQKLDKRKINPSNTSYANIEPCDFFVPPKSFFHLKDGTSSACISHLWNQGLVSGECFLKDENFRCSLRNMLNDSLKSEVPARKDTKPVANEYKIIFGIMREPSKNGNINIPFFSKVSFRAVFQRLTELGFQVFVNPIKKVSVKS